MSRLAAAAFIAFPLAVVAVVWVLWPQSIATETQATNDTGLQAGIATNTSAMVTALAPTVTPYLTSTPTRTPKPATSTPHATYGPKSQPGVYLVPAWTPTSTSKGTVEAAELVPCVTVTPDQYQNIDCEVL
jgi:hypothetical protein